MGDLPGNHAAQLRRFLVVGLTMGRHDKNQPRGPALTPEVMTPPGSSKTAKFAEVEGLKMGTASKALAAKLRARRLSGDAYRAEVLKRFQICRSAETGN